ncbi:unnamed protein product [Lymnaea stagnalis]|uniref:FERM domain-containing protein n=1 Tax=Lymnaea stagnalis TaxID=6523 RepID=A0AAV2IEH0_LYMST
MSKGGRFSRLIPKFLRGEVKVKGVSSSTEHKGPACLIIFLDDSEQRATYKANWKGQTLFDVACQMINLLEKDYFGLRFVDDSGQTHWLDLSKSLSSQLKGCSAPHKFYFGVKFYAADPCKLHEEITRYLFFLQVKRDILQGRLPVSFDEVAELCAYSVQSELGDFDPRSHTVGYVSEFSFVPNQTEELEARIASIHRRCVGATPVMAEQRYLEKVKWLEMYGVDLHPVQGESNVEYFLGLTPTGVVVYKQKTKVASYFWPRVTKASHKGKIFTIKVKDKNNEEHVYAFELSTKAACKHLWKCCVEHHAFFSGRSRRLAVTETRLRQQPNVQRSQSRRKPRRSNSDSRLAVEQMYNDQYAQKSRGLVTVMGQPEPVRAPRHRSLPELQGRQSPRSVKSAPWESKLDYGLYTSGHDSPSGYGERKDGKHPSFVSGSDSESGISQRKRYFPNRKGSDNESDASATRRRRRDVDSDSGSEVSFPNSAQNWKKRNTQSEKGTIQRNGHLLYPFHDKENMSHSSIPSLHSAPAGETKQRRRRRRSKSPGNPKRPPEELKQHIEFDLVDTEGMTEDQLRDITYTKVETKANLFRVKYSPKVRQKIWASRRKSFGDADKNSGQTQKTGSSSTLSRQDSYYTDPSGRYVHGSRISGSLSQGRLAGGQEAPPQRPQPMEVQPPLETITPSPRREQNSGYNSSRSYYSPVYTDHRDAGPSYRGGDGEKRNNRTQSDYEHYQSDGHQPDRYRQNQNNRNRLSYHEQPRATKSDYSRQDATQGNKRFSQDPTNQTQSDYSTHNISTQENNRYQQNAPGDGRYRPNPSDDSRYRQKAPDEGRYRQGNPHDDSRYSQGNPHDDSRYSQNDPSRRFQAGQPLQSTDHIGLEKGPATYNASNRGPYDSPDKYKVSTLPRAPVQRPPSYPVRDNSFTAGPRDSHSARDNSFTAVSRDSHPARDNSFTAGSRDSQTHTPSPRYNESVAGGSSGNSTPPRGSMRPGNDTRSTPPRSNSHYFEDRGLPQVSYSGQSGSSSGYGGSQNRQSGSSNASPHEQHRLRSPYTNQYGDRQSGQPNRYGQSPRGPASMANSEPPVSRQGYARSQHPSNYRSDLVTQL